MSRTLTLAATTVLLGAMIGACASTPSYDGQALYLDHCANCHGTYGEGDGVVTPDLEVVLQDLRYISARNDGVFPREWLQRVIDGRDSRQGHGPIGMPVWGAVFHTQEGYDEQAKARVSAKIDALVGYLARTQVSGSDKLE